MNTKSDRRTPERERGGRTIAIGDVHGCSNALRTLLDLIQPTSADEIITLGDLIDNGPDSRGVLEQVIRLAETCRVVPLRGNHEQMLLEARGSREALMRWLHFGGAQTLDSYGASGGWETIPAEHISFLESTQLFDETESHLFAHANCDPAVPMSEQSREALLWRFLDPVSARPHTSGKTLVVGHTPQRTGRVLDLGHTVCIDTDCWNGGWLTALDVATGRVWQARESGETAESRTCKNLQKS